MIHVEDLSFSYTQSRPLFRQFNWRVERGQSWAVLGPSGCGKTTLLYLLAGLQFPTSGSVLIDDQVLARPRPQTGLILQDFGLLPWNTVLDNIRLGLRIRRFYGPDGTHAPRAASAPPAGKQKDLEKTLSGWIERLGLSGLEKQYPGQLSGGQRQRVAIARTLVLQPDLLLMDEPFSSLDALTRLGLRELTLALQSEQRFTFVVITHAIEEAAHLGQNILVLGRPPHTQPQIVANPCFGRPNMAESSDYHRLLRQLQDQMAEAL